MASNLKTLTLSEAYPAAAASVPLARAAVADFARAAGLPAEQVHSLRLAVSEAVTNAVVHAFRGAARGHVQVSGARAGDELWVLVADDGCGFLHGARGAPGLGWGLALIAEVCEQFEIAERAGGGTELRMRFRLGTALASAADGPRESRGLAAAAD